MSRTYKHSEQVLLEDGVEVWPVLTGVEAVLRDELSRLFPGKTMHEHVAVEETAGSGRFTSCAQAAAEYAEMSSPPHDVHVRIGFNELVTSSETDLSILVRAMLGYLSRPEIYVKAEGPVESTVIGIVHLGARAVRDQLERGDSPLPEGSTEAPTGSDEPLWKRVIDHRWVYGIGTATIAGIIVVWVTQR